MLKKHKSKIVIILLASLGIVLIIASSFQKKTETNYDDYVESLEIKIEDFLKTVDGIKDADVIIMLEEYAPTKEASSSLFESNSSSDSSIPKVKGVAVACTNGDDYSVQVKVTGIVSSYLGISSNKIKIVALK